MPSKRPLLLLSDARFLAHAPTRLGGPTDAVPPTPSPSGRVHPERPERLTAAAAGVARGERLGIAVSPRRATREELLRVHSARLLEELDSWRGREGQLDADTVITPESVAVAEEASGGVVDLVRRLFAGEATQGVALVRPPGHHAERDRAMGFCLLNHVAVAAADARARGVSRVAIVDWDVHHGNGTQNIFWEDPSVLYISLHQWPFFPSSGARGERGEGAGAGFTVNIPLDEGSDDAVYQAAFQEIVVPILDAFAPELILVSAGYDASSRDPLGQMQLSARAFGWMTSEVAKVANSHANGRIALVLEGGYDLPSLEAGVAESVRGLDANLPPLVPGLRIENTSVTAARAAAARYWPRLASTKTG